MEQPPVDQTPADRPTPTDVPLEGLRGLQDLVAGSADTADLHATVPTLLLELQTLLGTLSATVTNGSERGRRPFRPGPDWSQRLGELAYGVFLLADQTGVDLAAAIDLTAQHLALQAEQARPELDNAWPFGN